MIEKKLLDIIDKKLGSDYTISKLGGMTNINYLIEFNDTRKYVLKTFGKGTNKLIDRASSKNNIYAIQKLDIDVEIIMYDIDNGFLITNYVDNSITLNTNTIKDEFSLKKIADTLYKLHISDVEFSNYFNVFDELRKYESILGGINNIHELADYKLNREKFKNLEINYENLNPTYLPCHNDLVPENFIKKDDKIYLIDWEYSGLNDPAFDIASLFIESEFTSTQEKIFLTYYKKDIDEKFKQKIMLFKICQDFLWSIWAVYKFKCGVDYMQYGIDRYNRGVRMMNEYISRYL